MAFRAVGVFDSGLGGLSVLREIAALLPGEALWYVADSLHAPYGERPVPFVVERTLTIGDWLVGQGVKALVVACNTATAHAIQPLRARFPALPVIGVEPGLKPAGIASRSKVVGVLATQGTLDSERFRRLLASLGGQCTFVCRAGHGLVARVEAGETDSAEVVRILRTCLAPMLDAGADTLVLGCTHYPFLAPAIERIAREAGRPLAIVDTGEAIARQLRHRLGEHALLAGGSPLAHRFCSTSDAAHLEAMVARLLGIKATAETLAIA